MAAMSYIRAQDGYEFSATPLAWKRVICSDEFINLAIGTHLCRSNYRHSVGMEVELQPSKLKKESGNDDKSMVEGLGQGGAEF